MLWCWSEQSQDPATNDSDSCDISRDVSSDPGSSSSDKIIDKRQGKINKLIEKQIKRDKRRYKSTHRVQLVGLPGSGKSTLIKQIRLVNAKFEDYYDNQTRAEKRNDIIKEVDKILERVLVEMPKRDLRASSADNLAKMKWFLEVDQETDENKENSEELTAAERNSVQQQQQGDEISEVKSTKYFDVVETLWRDPSVQKCFHILSREGSKNLTDNGRYFFEKMSAVRNPDYLPTDRDILRLEEPSQFGGGSGIREWSIRCDQSVFRVSEISGKQAGNKWVQYSNDALAVIFVVDASAFDVWGDKNRTRLQETLLYFQSVWTHPGLIQKSVLLFMNKQDKLEQKIKSRQSRLEDYFPELRLYTLPQAAFSEIQEGFSTEYLKAKYFIRDLFLQVAQPTSDVNHQCYPIFSTCVEKEEDFGMFINECCRDILQRVHLKMHEIL